MITMLTLLVFLLVCLTSAATDLHIGHISQFSGAWADYVGTRFLDVEDYFRNWIATSKGTTIGGTEWNFIWHHADGRTNKTVMSEIAYPFVTGTFDTQNQANWNYADHERLPVGTGKGVEPSPHALDVLILNYGSGFVPHALQNLKDNNMRLPVYAFGTNGLSAWQNADGSARWDFAVNGGETLATGELKSSIRWLRQQKAKTIIVVEEEGAGSWTQSLCDGARAEAKNLGMTIVADSVLKMEDCGSKIYPTESTEKKTLKECTKGNERRFADTYGVHLKKGKTYSADVIMFCAYDAYCTWLNAYLKSENINFGAYVGRCFAGDRFIEADWDKFLDSPEGKFSSDYWMWDQFSPEASAPVYDTRFNNVGLFSEAGENSASMCSTETYNFLEGTDRQKAGGYREALMFNTLTMFISDLERSQGDKTKLINFFGKKRMPITSHWGLLSSTEGGWSSFHEPQTTQKMPPFMYNGERKLIAPNHVANAQGVFPAPFWSKRACEGNCVRCIKCDEIQEQTPWIIACIAAPFAFITVGVFFVSLTRQFDITLTTTYIVMSAMQVASLGTDVCAVLTLFYELEEELIGESAALWAYAIFIGLGIYETFCRLKVNLLAVWIVAFTGSTQVDHACLGMLDESAILIAMSTVDLPIFAIQVYSAIWLSMSRILVTSMVATVFAIGYGVASLDKLAYLKTITQNAFDKDDRDSLVNPQMQMFSIVQKKGFRNVRKNDLLKRVINPCDVMMGITSRPLGTVAPSDYRTKVVNGDDKSL